MSNPLVSVIIPSYNGGLYIKEAVDSALSQTYQPVEVVVIDDGSADNTRQVLEPYIESKKIFYIYQKNKGLSAARNTGIKNARGTYIALLDSDDIFLPTKIERQVNFMELHPKCDLCYCDIVHFREEDQTKTLHLRYRYYSGDQVLRNLLKRNFINPLGVVMRQSVSGRFGYFNESFRRSEDWEFWVRLAIGGGQIEFLPERLAKYRIRKGSLSYEWKSEIERKEATLRIFLELRKLLSTEQAQAIGLNYCIFRHRIRLWLAYVESRSSTLRWVHRAYQDYRLKILTM
jgi:glycosyltransferase involved in cell wall biosynthesis